MKFLKHIVIIFFYLIIFTTCKKYPENNLWFKTPDGTITGEWKLEKYSVNNVDSTNADDMQAYLYGSFTFHKRENKGIFNQNDSSGDLQFSTTLPSNGGLGKWSFDKKKKEILMSIGYVAVWQNNLQKLIFKNGKWVIKKLTKKQFWVTNQYNNTEYEIHFKK